MYSVEEVEEETMRTQRQQTIRKNCADQIQEALERGIIAKLLRPHPKVQITPTTPSQSLCHTTESQQVKTLDLLKQNAERNERLKQNASDRLNRTERLKQNAASIMNIKRHYENKRAEMMLNTPVPPGESSTDESLPDPVADGDATTAVEVPEVTDRSDYTTFIDTAKQRLTALYDVSLLD